MDGWIIFDTDERMIVGNVYTDYNECVSDANRIDNGLILLVDLPDEQSNGEG